MTYFIQLIGRQEGHLAYKNLLQQLQRFSLVIVVVVSVIHIKTVIPNINQFE